MKWLRIGGLVAVVLAVVIVAYLMLRQLGGARSGSAAASASANGEELGAPAPEAVRKSPKAAKEHVERQNCLANCAAEARTCQATADGAEAEQRCRDQGRACESECP